MGFCLQHIGLNWHYIGFELVQLRMLAVVDVTVVVYLPSVGVGVAGSMTFIMFVGSMM